MSSFAAVADSLSIHNRQTKNKKNSCSNELMIGIAEGGARTHDLEVDLFAVDKSHTLYQLSYPGKGVIDGEVVVVRFM